MGARKRGRPSLLVSDWRHAVGVARLTHQKRRRAPVGGGDGISDWVSGACATSDAIYSPPSVRGLRLWPCGLLLESLLSHRLLVRTASHYAVRMGEFGR